MNIRNWFQSSNQFYRVVKKPAKQFRPNPKESSKAQFDELV
jgi:hypothetical protein